MLTEAELARLDPVSLAYLKWQADWTATARPNQIIPKLHPETGEPWTECGLQAGRGFGKTRVGAEWLGREVFEDPSGFPSTVICPTFTDVKFTAFEGKSGLLNVIPPDLVINYNRSDLTIEMKNIGGGKALIRGFSSEKPDRLRGPESCRGWLDEISTWQNPQETWDMFKFGLRIGDNPQTLWTSTPKPKELVRKLTAPKAKRFIIRGSTYDNKENLAEAMFEGFESHLGTALGRQEIFGELIDPEETGIVKRSWFRIWPHDKPLPQFSFIIVSLDTAFTERTIDKKTGDPDATACTVWGVFQHEKSGQAMLLEAWDDYLGFPELIRRTKREMNARYGDDEGPTIRPLYGPEHSQTSQGRRPDLLLIEQKGSGISLIQALAQEGLFAQGYNPGRQDKLTRLHSASRAFARRRIWLPESSNPSRKGQPVNWCENFVSQVCSFTGNGSIKRDDYVDSGSQAINLIHDQGMFGSLVPTREERERSNEEDVQRQARGPRQNPYSM